MTIKDLAIGDFFTLKDYDGDAPERSVYVRGRYDHKAKRYACHKWADVNHETFFKGTRTAFVEFVF